MLMLRVAAIAVTLPVFGVLRDARRLFRDVAAA